jgi:hypothetical protein
MLFLPNLAVSREGPPVSGFAGTSLMDCGREYIPNARIVVARRFDLQLFIEPVGIACGKVFGAGDAKYVEIGTGSRPNVAQAHECMGRAVRAPHGSAAHEATSLHISTRKPLLSRT